MSITACDWPAELDRLPGAELIRKGLEDLEAGQETEETLLIEIAAPRLAGLGVRFPAFAPVAREAELRLYERLQPAHGAAAHGAYNALLRRLGRFCHAMDARAARGSPADGNG